MKIFNVQVCMVNILLHRSRRDKRRITKAKKKRNVQDLLFLSSLAYKKLQNIFIFCQHTTLKQFSRLYESNGKTCKKESF